MKAGPLIPIVIMIMPFVMVVLHILITNLIKLYKRKCERCNSRDISFDNWCMKCGWEYES